MINSTAFELRRWLTLPVLVLAAAVVGLIFTLTVYDWQGFIIVAVVICLLAVYILPRFASKEQGNFLLIVLTSGLALKLLASLVRIFMAFSVYEGAADAADYSYWGTIISQHIWRLEFDQLAPFFQWGTATLRLFTGIVYTVIGPTLYGGYLVFAFLSFLGSYCFYRAFTVAFPQGNHKLFAILLFLFPSILYWANGIGKDAVIFLCIGLFALGSARLSDNKLNGLLAVTAGLIGVTVIRPHIGAILAIALGLAFATRTSGKNKTNPATFLIGLIALAGLAWFLLPRAIGFIGLEGLSAEEISGFLEKQQGLTTQGGSSFNTVDILNPINFPVVLATILFRPFPWEANNILAMVQSLEGLVVMGLVILNLKNLKQAFTSALSQMYIRFILFFGIEFVIAFSAIGNFGILARERVMMLPFFFMLLAYRTPQTQERAANS
jgi:hypothetical protein